MKNTTVIHALTRTSPTNCPECLRVQHLCHEHGKELLRMLNEVPAKLQALEETFARQTAIGERVGPRSSETPLPYSWEASEATDILLAGTVQKWAKTIWRANQATEYPHRPVLFLVTHLPQIVKRSWSVAMYVELENALIKATRVVDLPKERLEVGQCQQCNRRLQASPNESVVECKCGARYDIAELRGKMLDSIQDMWFSAAELERWVLMFLRMGEDQRIKRRRSADDEGTIAKTIRKWGERGVIRVMHHGPRRQEYLTREVLDRFLAASEREEAREAAREAARGASRRPASSMSSAKKTAA